MRTLQQQYQRAKQVIPGGVNSSVRMNQAIGMPFYVSQAKGSRVWDIQGREFIDMCCGHGAALLGHAHPAIDAALARARQIGYASVFETEYHEELARRVCRSIPCAERVRFCSSGTEATLHLIRACRAYTSRNRIIRFEGHFHGYHELIYIGGHPPVEVFENNRQKPYIESAGIPQEFAEFIIPIPYNDPDALEQAISKHGHETALVVLEPINYNCGCIKPQPGYLELLRWLTREAGIVLFFDEIQSAFKKSRGGAQQDLGVVPDVCTIGKSLGGGLPLSAFAGRADIMETFRPTGPTQHSGTFNGSLLAILAGLAFLEEIEKPDFYLHLQSLESRFQNGVNEIVENHDLNMVVPCHGARFDFVLGRRTFPIKYEDTFCHDNEKMLRFIEACFDKGVYFHDYGGSPVHHGFSVQHSIEDIDNVLDVIEDSVKSLR